MGYKIRGFEVISKYSDMKIEIPQRKTAKSAGYDLRAIKDYEIAPGEIVLVETGLKAYMNDNEFLGIYPRSGTAIKQKLTLINCVGVIDADYVDNPDNEGHIMIPLINHGNTVQHIKKEERVAQGIFHSYKITSDDCPGGARTGGFGSTGK